MILKPSNWGNGKYICNNYGLTIANPIIVSIRMGPGVSDGSSVPIILLILKTE
jgi:hypothetical protein